MCERYILSTRDNIKSDRGRTKHCVRVREREIYIGNAGIKDMIRK